MLDHSVTEGRSDSVVSGAIQPANSWAKPAQRREARPSLRAGSLTPQPSFSGGVSHPHTTTLIEVFETESDTGLKPKRVGRSNRQVYRVAPLDSAPQLGRIASQQASNLSVPGKGRSTRGPSIFGPMHNVNDSSVMSIDEFVGASKHPSNAAVHKWKVELARDKGTFSSVATWCEVTYQRVVTETRNATSPNPLRTAVCCMLLDRLAGLLGDSEALARKLLGEVYNSIYVEWDEYVKRKFIQVARQGQAATSHHHDESASHSSRSALDVDNPYDGNDHEGANQKMLVASLNQRQTFFDAYTQLQSQRIRVVGRPARVLEMTINQWRLKVLGAAFLAWRNDCVLAKRRANKIRNGMLAIKQRRSAKSVRSHFHAWHTYVFERRHQCRVVYEESSRIKLVHRMGRRIKELEAENDETHKNFDRLMEEHLFVAKQLRRMETLFSKFKRDLTRRESNAAASDDLHYEDAADFQELGEQGSGLVASPFSRSFPADAAGDEWDAAASGGASPEGRDAMFAENDALLLGHSGLGGAGGGGSGGPAPTVQDVAPAVAHALAQPNRVEQLSKFLQLQTDQVNGLADGQQPQPFDMLASFLAPAGEGGAAATVAAEGASAAKSSAPKKIARFATSPTPSGDGAPANYRDVLDWVSLRTQLILTANQPAMRRCTNFTNDFKDGIRLAYLLLSLGAEKSLLDEIYAAPNLIARATRILDVARCFFEPGDEMFSTVQMHPVDLIKAKGAKISRLLFGLYSKYSGLPLVMPSGPLNPRLANALRKASDGGMGASVLAAPGAQQGGVAGAGGGDELEASRRVSVAPSNDAVDDEPEPLPDAQYMEWFRDLAADDSDIGEVEEFFDARERKQSALKAVASRLSSHLSMHENKHKAMTATRNSESNKRARAIGGRVVKFDAKATPQQQLFEWVQDKLAVASDGAQSEQDLARLRDIDMLESLVHSLLPEVPLATSRDPKARLLVLQKVLHERLHLHHIKLRPSGAIAAERAISLKQLVTALYVLNADVVLPV